MKRLTADRTLTSQQRALLGGLAGLAVLVGANALMARLTEHRHPPQGSFLEVDGVRLHYTDRGEGTPIVLIHGNDMAGDDWTISGVADLLLRTHRVIIFDRPGFGHSSRPSTHVWTATRQADLIHDAMRQLGVDRPVVVGHSLGAIIALALAERHQADVGGLVLLSGYYFWTLRPDVLLVTLGALPVLGAFLGYTVLPLLGWLQMPMFKWSMFAPAPVPARFDAGFSTAMALRPSQLHATSVDGSLMGQAVLGLRGGYEDLALPVVIMAGDGDKVVPVQTAQQLHARIPGSVLRVIRGAGHMLHHVAPQQVTDVIEDVAMGRPIRR